MRALVLFFCTLFITCFLGSCTVNPEPIVFGEDQCHFCKMTIVDAKFGAELVTRKGKVYKFDDLACFLDYCKSGYEAEDDYAHRMVVDFAGNGTLIDATAALYVVSPEIRSPMNGQAAAFLSESARENANKQWDGTTLTWQQLAEGSR